ncbi:ChaN family lipoprotein [Rhizobacter sp. P5_C2]
MRFDLGLCCATALLLAGCALSPAHSTPPAIVLLGEVHDNAAQHALRLAEFRQLLDTGARPALLMEQFDRDRQPDIDRLRAAAPAPTAAALIAAAGGGPGWNWAFYSPFVQLALDHGLPIVAVNVSRADSRQVISKGLADTGFSAEVPEAIWAAHTGDIEDSHCGMIDAATARRMAGAQVARDQFMARSVEAYAERGVVLLAGNGHVRRDVGVPRWLADRTRARSRSVGYLEDTDAPPAGAYDRVVVTPAQPREDPCAAMRKPAD